MKFFKNIRTGLWPILTVAFLMAGLWGFLIFNGIPASEPAGPGEQSQTAYEEILPNFLAPVIRKDVRKESSSEEESEAINISLPRLDVLFTIWK